jgi:hypothetical protein
VLLEFEDELLGLEDELLELGVLEEGLIDEELELEELGLLCWPGWLPLVWDDLLLLELGVDCELGARDMCMLLCELLLDWLEALLLDEFVEDGLLLDELEDGLVPELFDELCDWDVLDGLELLEEELEGAELEEDCAPAALDPPPPPAPPADWAFTADTPAKAKATVRTVNFDFCMA